MNTSRKDPGGTMLTKKASRWRTLVRSGALSPQSLSELRNMGLLHTPEMIAREVAGLSKGTEAQMARHGVPFIKAPTSHFGTGKTLTPFDLDKVNFKEEFAGLRNFGNSLPNKDPVGLRENLKVLNAFGQDVDRAKGSLKDLFSEMVNPRLKHVSPKVVGAGQFDVRLLGPRNASPAVGDSIRGLVNRHEADEALQLLRKIKKNPELRTRDLKKLRWSSHMSPEVVMREAGHANFVAPEAADSLARVRRLTGEQASINRAAGRELPYNQWDVQGPNRKGLVRRAEQQPPKLELKSMLPSKSGVMDMLSQAFKGRSPVNQAVPQPRQ